MTALIVIAKAPVAGRVKTRLSPPCTPQQAATLAQAALEDTFAAVCATPATRHVCALDGEPGAWLPRNVEVMPQRGAGLDERLAAAFADVGEPAVLVGMDTPQLTPSLLTDAQARLERADAVLGPAADGGYWSIGLHAARDELFHGVPMSADDTGARQHERLLAHGLRVDLLDEMLDCDTYADARAVAALAPSSRVAAAVAQVTVAEGTARA